MAKTERPRERLLSEGQPVSPMRNYWRFCYGWVGKTPRPSRWEWRFWPAWAASIGLLHCSVEELCAIPGVGPAKAAQLKAAVEVGKRAVSAPLTTGTRINPSADLFKHYHARLRDLRHEILPSCCWMLRTRSFAM